MPYRMLRPVLFRLPGESAHDLTLSALRLCRGIMPLLHEKPPAAPRRIMGIDFANPVGLAAGLDKNGDYIDALAGLGFGFIEIGTVTPRPQPGNARPRLFRLPQAGALINRMGFNNKGVDYLVKRVQQARYRGALGINIGKNSDTEADRAIDDYLLGLRKVYPYATYVTVNISSPNTAGLRDLQFGENLNKLLDALKKTQNELADEHRRYVPLAVKIAPDLEAEDIAGIARALIAHKIDAVIATNTTFSRAGVENLACGNETGGLSGAPLFARSTGVIQGLHTVIGGRLPIIAAGGIMKGADAAAKIRAGASLVQIYTGLVYRGPGLIRHAVKAIGNIP